MKMGTIHLTLAYQTLKWVSLKGPLEEPVGTQACKWIYFRVSMQSGSQAALDGILTPW